MRRANSGCIGEPSSRWRNMTRTDWTPPVSNWTRYQACLWSTTVPSLPRKRGSANRTRVPRGTSGRASLMRGLFGLTCQALSLL